MKANGLYGSSVIEKIMISPPFHDLQVDSRRSQMTQRHYGPREGPWLARTELYSRGHISPYITFRAAGAEEGKVMVQKPISH